ncbi:putative glycolipid-binding domain-containing protein [Kitasatospora sp. NPDC097605]|uniref:putative glycolipid-binding domain-containing protein n=1 Tax=Kitasatospora sp. NPDC097605 TaxID=3157226 RepID=UPI0033206EF0
MITHLVPTWEVSASGGVETAWIELGDGTLRAHGRVAGLVPAPYWIDYELDTGPAWTTRRLAVRAASAEGTRELELLNDGGRWTVDGRHRPELDGALDCDLGLSPLTNAMPVLRHRLHREPGRHEFLMAWVRVPDLTVHPSRQTYTHLGPAGDDGGGDAAAAATVRYESGDFSSDLLLDRHGLVLDYPDLARRHRRHH